MELFFYFSLSVSKANSEPLATIQDVNSSKHKKETEKPKKCSPEKGSDSKAKSKKVDPLQRSLDCFRVRKPSDAPLKSHKKSEEKDNVESPKKTEKRENFPVTPTKGAKEALVILDKCPKISPVKVKCKGDSIMVESLSSSTESDENENSFEIKTKVFRCTPKSKEKANAFSLLRSPQAGRENSAKKKSVVKQKKEKNAKGKQEKEEKEKNEKKEDGKSDSSRKNESKKIDKMEIKLMRIEDSLSKSSVKTLEKKNEKKTEKMEQKIGDSSSTVKTKEKSKDSGSKKSSKKSSGNSGKNKEVKKLIANEETNSKESDISCVVIVEDSQDVPDTNTVSSIHTSMQKARYPYTVLHLTS